MNTLESCIILSPSSAEEECAKFSIDETLSQFVLHNITSPGEKYTFSLWIRSENEGSIVTKGKTIPTSSEWSRHTVTFTTNEVDVGIYFNTVDTYYIYHPKLEQGSKASDWTEAPEDLTERIGQVKDMATDTAGKLTESESIIQQIVDRISMLVTDSEGTSLWEQTAEDGWTFSMAQTKEDIESIRGLLSDLEESIGDVDATVEVLDNSMSDIKSSIEWIKATTYEDEPCIALGETDSDFKLFITNTRIMFVEGSSVPAYISNQTLNIKKAVIEEELQQGEFVWKVRSNGNMGLLWKGVIS